MLHIIHYFGSGNVLHKCRGVPRAPLKRQSENLTKTGFL